MNDIVLNGKERIAYLRHTMETAIDRGLMQEIDAPLDHYHANGLYGRRIYVQGGATVITKVHLTQHITVALKGTCTVYGENGSRKIVTSPDVFVTEPGTQRAIYCHDDVEWITVHNCELKDVPEIEHEIFCDNFQEYDDRTDYKRFLLEFGLSECLARSISENIEDQTLESEANIDIKPSELEGLGVFSKSNFSVNDLIGIARTENGMRTLIGRYTNHSKHPNVKFVDENSIIKAYAIENIQTGEELTTDYRKAIMLSMKLRYLS